MTNPFRYFKTSPEIIRLAVMLYVRFPLSLRNVEDLLHERGIEVSHETIRVWVSFLKTGSGCRTARTDRDGELPSETLANKEYGILSSRWG